MESILGIIIGVIVVLAVLLSASLRIVQEYERGVIFRLGRLLGAKGPGLFFIIPIIDRMQKVDLRLITMDVPAQEVITKDNVTVKVNAVLYFRVQDPQAVVVRITDFISATSQLSQTTLRNVCGQSELDEILAEREQINVRLQQIIDEATEAWGVKVTSVEVKDIELPQGMQRAMARRAALRPFRRGPRRSPCSRHRTPSATSRRSEIAIAGAGNASSRPRDLSASARQARGGQ